MYDYENPPMPDSDFDNEGNTDVRFYKPEVCIISQLIEEDKDVKSLIHLLDQTLLETPPASETEKESGEITEQETEVVNRHIKLEEIESGWNSDESEESFRSRRKLKHRKKKREGKERIEEHPIKDKVKDVLDKEKKHKKHRRSPEKSSKITYRERTSIRYRSPSPEVRNRSVQKTSNRYRSASPEEINRNIQRETTSSRYRSPSPEKINRNFQREQKSNRYRSPSPEKINRNFQRGQTSNRYRSPSPENINRNFQREQTSNRYRSPSPENINRNFQREHASNRYRSPSPEKKSKNAYRGKVPSRYRSPSPCRLSSRRRSISPRRSPNRQLSPDRRHENEERRLDDCDKNYSGPEDRERDSHNRRRKIPIVDEYSRILVEEMRNRQLISCSDSESDIVESTEVGQNGKTVKEPVVSIKQEPISQEPSTSRFVKQENKIESVDMKGVFLDCYYCQDCQLTLNSELTWQSHIRGKRHAKVLKAQAIHEVAKGSIAIPSNPFVSEDTPRFASPAAGRNHIPLNEPAKLQTAVNEHTKHPLPGLDRLLEIRSDSEVNYYCELCDAPCGPTSVMPHLIGFKHQLRCMRDINPDFYEANKLRPKRSIEHIMIKMLFSYERRYGKGTVRVVAEKRDPQAIPNPVESLYFDLPGPSWKNSVPIKQEAGEDGVLEMPANDECLDTSKSDFYCKLCDSHMNNFNMWAAHVRGKRHLKNAKKIPGENISKAKSVKAPPDVPSKLEELLHKEASDEIVVGLDYIRETQGPNGEFYNCFLCGACTTNFDVLDHILLTKHRTKYLEKLATDGKENAITTISQMDLGDNYFRENLIIDECIKMVNKYGPGNVEVYISKTPTGSAW